MSFLSDIYWRQGAMLIPESLNTCMDFLDQFPRRWRYKDFQYGYGIDNKAFRAPNHYFYTLFVWNVKTTHYQGGANRLYIRLEGLNESQTQLNYTAKIPIALFVCYIGLIFFGVFESFLVLNLSPILFSIFGLLLIYNDVKARGELIEFHLRQFAEMKLDPNDVDFNSTHTTL